MPANVSAAAKGRFAISVPPAAAPRTGARVALALLLAINLFNYIDRYVLAAALPKIQTSLFPVAGPNDKAQMGMLSMAFMLSYMTLAPLFGWLADRVSRWLLIGVGVVLWSLASGASGLATTFTVLLITRCFVGVGEAAYGPAAPTLIADLFPVERRGRVLSWFYMAIPVGSALGFALGGIVADSALGWPWAFFLVVPPGLALGLCCFFMREPPVGDADAAPTRQARFQDYLVLLRTPSFVLNTLGMTAMTFALGGIAYWMPDYIHHFRQQPDLGQVSTIFGGIVVLSGLSATLLGGLAGDWLRPRFPGSYFLVSAAGMFLGFPLFLAVLYVPFPWAWVLIFLACFCLFFNTGPTNTALANVTHPAIRASAFAVNIFIIHALGDAISPTIIGAITDASGGDMNVGFLAVSAMILIGGLLWLWGARYLEMDTKLALTRLSE
jgi:MFS family permease